MQIVPTQKVSRLTVENDGTSKRESRCRLWRTVTDHYSPATTLGKRIIKENPRARIDHRRSTHIVVAGLFWPCAPSAFRPFQFNSCPTHHCGNSDYLESAAYTLAVSLVDKAGGVRIDNQPFQISMGGRRNDPKTGGNRWPVKE